MIANHKGNDLASTATNRGPEPVFGCFDEDKRPDFIQFQHIFAYGLKTSTEENRKG